MRCTACGAPLPAGAQFCSSCGRAVEAAPPRKAWKVVKWTLLVLFAGFAGMVAFGWYLGKQSRPEAQALIQKLTAINRQLPSLAGLAERSCPAAVDGNATYFPMDSAFLRQFADSGFVPAGGPSVHWYRAAVLEKVQKTLVVAKSPETQDSFMMAQALREMNGNRYLGVFHPIQQAWPVLDAKAKTFQGGYFDGWLILVDTATGQPLCQTRFEARSSAEVKAKTTKIGIRPKFIPVNIVSASVSGGLGEAIAQDFVGNFWRAAEAARKRIAPGK